MRRENKTLTQIVNWECNLNKGVHYIISGVSLCRGALAELLYIGAESPWAHWLVIMKARNIGASLCRG